MTNRPSHFFEDFSAEPVETLVLRHEESVWNPSPLATEGDAAASQWQMRHTTCHTKCHQGWSIKF